MSGASKNSQSRFTEGGLRVADDALSLIGKTPLVVNDTRGFYTSRVVGTYVTEGLAML